VKIVDDHKRVEWSTVIAVRDMPRDEAVRFAKREAGILLREQYPGAVISCDRPPLFSIVRTLPGSYGVRVTLTVTLRPLTEDCGYVWRAEPAPDWAVMDGTEKANRCRWGRPSCKRPAVAKLLRVMHLGGGRGSRGVFWAYCEDHMFGNWLEDGRVMGWVLRESR
jgi:hypothetical protein